MRAKVLVVDDEELIATVLRIALSAECDVEYAANGREALDKISGAAYDVFLVDMNMPVMNGMEFYKEAVKTFSGIKERIIFYTGSCEEGCLSFFREHNLRYLTKPTEPQDLKNTVKEMLKAGVMKRFFQSDRDKARRWWCGRQLRRLTNHRCVRCALTRRLDFGENHG